MSANAFLQEQVRLGALRWLHALDLSPASATWGCADREYWAWKTRDFANGTWQGGLNGVLHAQSLLPFTPIQWRKLIEATLAGSLRIQRGNGSFEEAYPYESSYAVTALVAFDLASAYYCSPTLFSPAARKDLHEVLQRAIAFLEKTPETHGVIANHLATGLMAEHLASPILTGTPLPAERYRAFMVLQHPTEHWFPEYGGADPGYQTLLNHYLAGAHAALPLPADLVATWEKSIAFTAHFRFPDDSFAGEVGSRGTAIVYPSGTLSPQGGMPTHSFFDWVCTAWAPSLHAVTPTSVDSGNFVPVFNSWALAWYLSQRRARVAPTVTPALAPASIDFPSAGLRIVETARAKLVFSRRNGALRRTVERDGHWQDESLVSLMQGTRSTQQLPPRVLVCDEALLHYRLDAMALNSQLNSPLRSIILRLVGMALYPFPRLQRVFKRFLAAVIMDRKPAVASSGVEVKIDLKSETLELKASEAPGWLPQAFGFHKHMASANTFSTRAI